MGNLTNQQFIIDLMNYSKCGAMAEMVVVEALRYYTELIIKKNRPTDTGNSLVNAQLWWDACAEIHNKMLIQYEPGHKDV